MAMSWDDVLAEVDDFASYVRQRNEDLKRQG
jgi:hypothetical protein